MLLIGLVAQSSPAYQTSGIAASPLARADVKLLRRQLDEKSRPGARMQIALVVDGTRGDIQPMLVLGRALAAEGHTVRLCAPPDFREAAKVAGLEFRAVGMDVRAYLTSHAHALQGRPIHALREAVRYARECLRAQFEALPEATSNCQYLIGAGIQLAGPSVAALRGVPYTYVAYCPILFPSGEYPSMVLPHQTLPSWANRLSWHATRAFFNQVFRRILGERRAELGLPPVRDVLDYLVGERPTLAADHELAPLPSDCAIRVRRIRALQPSPGDPLPAKLDSFLQQGPPPVYVGFGSMTDSDSARTTREIAKALSAVGCRAIVSRGWAGLGGVPLPEGVLEIGAVCHVRLFPQLAAVVHHGGAGTTTAAARAGIPQIVVPHIADQPYWGRRVELLGIGPPAIPRKRFSAQTLEAALTAILDNEIVAERASELAGRLRARAAIDVDPILGS
ncbi:MAG TPA: glycosyltransferase [Myxococcota bacterium]|nr:glycosyltransferase [Myxococcota bacterium]